MIRATGAAPAEPWFKTEHPISAGLDDSDWSGLAISNSHEGLQLRNQADGYMPEFRIMG
jgi:hypothetical protein